MNDYRDTRLGDLLRRADEAPPLATDFYDRLWTRIESERVGRRGSRTRRTSRFAGLTRTRRWSLALAAAAAAVAALVLFGFPGGDVAEKIPGGSAAQDPAAPVFRGPEPASAAEVADIVQKALRDAATIVADLYYCDYKAMHLDRPKADDNRTRLVVCADGSYRATPLERLVPAKWGDRTIDVPGIVGSDRDGDASYDATTGVRRSWGAGFDRLMVAPPGAYENENEVPLERVEAAVFVDAQEETGCDPTTGSVESMNYPVPDIGPTQFSGVVYALRASGDAALRTTTFDGRPAWIVSCPVAPQPEAPGDEAPWPNGRDGDDSLIITIDKATGLPVRSQQIAGDKVHADWCLMNLQVDVRVPEDTFTLDFPSGLYRDEPASTSTTITRIDNGFRPVTVDQVESAIGRAALVPTHVPSGYELAQVAVKQRGASPDDDAFGTTLALRYGRGFDSLAVKTQVLDPAVASRRSFIARDPFIDDSWPGSTDARTPIELTSGVFAGGRGFVVVGPLTTPHLWGVKDGMVLMVGGDASAAQLVAVANSIEEWEP